MSREICNCLASILNVFEEEGLALLSEFEFIILARDGSFALLQPPSRINKPNRDVGVRQVNPLLDHCWLVQIKVKQFALGGQMHNTLV